MEFRARHGSKGFRAPAILPAMVGVVLMLVIAPPASAIKITEFPTGLTYGGERAGYITAGPDGNLWVTAEGGGIERCSQLAPFDGRIARITPTGVVTVFSNGITGQPVDITAGPGGDLWFTVRELESRREPPGTIGRITPTGLVTEFFERSTSLQCFPEFELLFYNPPGRITTGAEGDLWVVITPCCIRSSPEVARISAELSVTHFSVGFGDTEHVSLHGITLGRERDLWVSEGGALVRISPEGVHTEFPLGVEERGVPYDITTGPEGNLWFTEGEFSCEEICRPGRIGRMTPTGAVTEFSKGITGSPDNITVGPDGNLWFTEPRADRIGRVTPRGTITEFSHGITPGARPFAITAGPDSTLWFTEAGTGDIGRVKLHEPHGRRTHVAAATSRR